MYISSNILRKNLNLNFAHSYAKSSKVLESATPESFFQKASSAHTQGNLIEAETLYKKALKLDPDCHKASFNLAIVHHENGQINSAKTRIQNVLKKENLDLQTQALFAKSLAKIHQELGKLDLAAKYYKIALTGYPKDKDLLDNLGNAYASLGKSDEALEYFKKAVEVDPTDMKTKMKLALTLQDFKKMKEAMVVFEDILKEDPNNVEALLGMGVCLTYLIDEDGHGSKAEIAKKKDSIQKYFNRAFHLEPQNPHVLLNFGIFNIEQGINKSLGNQYLSQALQIAPNDIDLCYSIAFLKFKNGHNSEALGIFEKILAQEPKHSESMVHIGIIHQEKGDVNKAIKYYRAAVEIDPKNTQNRNLLGMVLQESGNLADALDQFLAAVKEDRKDWSVHMNLATIYRQLNQISQSDHHRAICIKLNKESIKMFEMADAEDTDTDASIDSLSWTNKASQDKLNAPGEGEYEYEYEDEYEVTPSEDDRTDDSDDDHETNHE